MAKRAARPIVKRLVFKLGRRTRDSRRCHANVGEFTARWREFAGKDNRCELGAMYVVNGELLCKRHAGDRLITLLVTGDQLVEPSQCQPEQPARTKG